MSSTAPERTAAQRADAPDLLRYDQPAHILDGRPLAAEMRRRVRRQLADFRGRYGHAPGLAAVMVGQEVASRVADQTVRYRGQLRSCS